MKIRKAEESDINELCILMQELSGHPMSEEQMRDRLKFIEESKTDFLYVCEEGNTVLGLFAFRIRENIEKVSRYGEISAIVAKPENRNMGVGRFMMDYAEKLAKDFGCIGTWLVSGFGRENEAHVFYNRLGYNTNGYRFVKLFN